MKTLVHLRFDEESIEVPPSDDAGSLLDLSVNTGSGWSTPPVTDAFTGRGRVFAEAVGFYTTDATPGASLSTRDVTVQAIVQFDFDAAYSSGWFDAPIIVRGASAGPSADWIAYGVELRMVNLALRIAELRFRWKATSGGDRIQLGGQFILPDDGGYIMVTATRHWVSSSQVEIQYYVGDQLVGDFVSADGDIGGGTTGTTTIGVRREGGIDQAWFNGIIDEIRVTDTHMTAEEVAATWARLTKWQPAGYATMKQLFQTRAPISNDPSSRVQKLFRGLGHALGYANAQIDNYRQNVLPDRAYGDVLTRWETITGEPARTLDTVAQRRRRVVGHLRQRQGVSPPGAKATVADLLALAASQIQIFAFSQTQRDDFSAGLQTARWFPNPSAQWTISGGALRVQAAAASDRTLKTGLTDWYTCLTALQGEGRQGGILAKLNPTTLGTSAEVGVCLFDWANGNAFLFGMRNNAGTIQLVYERFEKWVSQGVNIVATPAQVTHWLHLFQQQDTGVGFYNSTPRANHTVAWSTTAELGPYTPTVDISHTTFSQWCGVYARGITNSLGVGGIDATFDDVSIRAPFGDRPFYWYIFRDPTLAGTPDLIGAQRAAQQLAQAQTKVGVVSTMVLKCDSADSLCDNAPMGGI